MPQFPDMNITKENQSFENIQDLFAEENRIILKVVSENLNLFVNDLEEIPTPLIEHNWQVMARKLLLHGLQYSWEELRAKVRYWMKNGIIVLKNGVCQTETEESQSDSDLSIDWNLLSNISKGDFESMPYTSTPKSSIKNIRTTGCSADQSADTNNNQDEQNVQNQGERHVADKVVQTSLTNAVESNSPQILYYLDSEACELKPVTEEEAVVLEAFVNGNQQQPKRRKVEMSTYESKLLKLQNQLTRQKLEQKEKEHEMKMKLLQQQLQMGAESHRINMEINQLMRDRLMQKYNSDRSLE